MALTEAEATTRAEAEVRAFCGWHIAPELSEVLILDGSGSRTLLLPSLRVSAITEVVDDGTVLDPSSYEWSASGVLRRTGAARPSLSTWGPRWSSALRGVQVSLTHGFPEMPLDVKTIVERLATRAVEGASVLAQVGQVSYAVGEDGLPATATLSTMDRAVLARYKLPARP